MDDGERETVITINAKERYGMKYEDFDKALDFYNFNLSKKYSVDYRFNIIPTTFDYGFFLIASSDYEIKEKDCDKIKKAKDILWKYIRYWNCKPNENTYTNQTSKDLFFESTLPKRFRTSEDVEKLNLLKALSGDVYIGDKVYKGGVTHVSAIDYKSVDVAHQMTEKKIESTDECDQSDWMKDGKSLLYKAQRPKKGTNIRIYLSDDILDDLEKEFSVTQFSSRMSGSFPENESIDVRMIYYVEQEKPYLDLIINKINKYDGKVTVACGEIDAKVCRLIEGKFHDAHIVVHNDNLNSTDVLWKKPFDWYDVPKKNDVDTYDESKIVCLKKQEEFKEKYAVYMWVGHKKNEQNEKYLYVGIVGTRGNKDNSVGKRILDQERVTGIAAQNNVIIDKIRFSAIEKIGSNVSMDEVLQTVEMQCINNISSLFGYISTSKPKEKIISNLFDGIYFDSEVSSFKLLNDKKRYHN